MKKEVLSNLEKNYSTYSKSFKKIVDFIKHNQSIVSFISINELAKETETSPATITRFSKNLGFKGYPDFQRVFQKDLEISTSQMREFRDEIGTISTEGVLEEIITTNISLLEEIDISKKEAQLNAAIDMIKNSRKLYILGARGSYALAHYLYFMLKELRNDVELMISGASDFTDRLVYSEKEDLLFTISFHPYTNFTCQVTEFFKNQGNKIITMTDKEDSILGNMSDLVMTTKNGGKACTFVPGIVILNALILKFGSEQREESMEKLDKLKIITDTFDIYHK
ncbi:MurR/RpiR family transcriptional regulator [uncultured Cetobacterium sp.]|uniref:MurR/RpiR family transcriptional regulator n=1 Tax=uncultured Cetobacterium sp. TaxID=527638 RepID=UPI0026219E3A|nr:MurR/RpiR family transcriptional regulator [uncultured Cetobacterium sp.]